MKTPITYYGGKQQLSNKILMMIPEHKVYCEAFIGGGAVFFAKDPAPVEIINDTNQNLINFYEVCQMDFQALQKEIKTSLHSRDIHRKALVVLNNPDLFDKIKRAWAVWVVANSSFGSEWDAGWGYDRSGSATQKLKNKRSMFTEKIAERLQSVQLECCDALKIIKSRDTSETFFYLDPPYPNTDQGHYDGYSSADFRELLEVLSKTEGKFLLSSFRHEYLTEFTELNSWHQIEIRMPKPMTVQSGRSLQKIEVLTANYPISL